MTCRDGRAHPSPALTRRALLGTGAAVAGAALSAVPSAASTGRTLFVDHFTRTTVGPRWTAYNRVAHVRDGRLQVDGDYLPDAAGRDGWLVTNNGNRAWQHYEVSALVDATNATGFPGEVHMATLYAKVDDLTSGTGRATCYRLDLWPPGPDPRTGTGTLPHGMVVLDRVVGGTFTQTVVVERSNFRPGLNRVAWRIVHGRHRVRVNGVATLDWRDPSPLRAGGVGVGAIWETDVAFDDVVVTAVVSGSGPT